MIGLEEPPKRGRPAMGNHRMVQFYMNEEAHAELEEWCKKLDRPKAHFLRYGVQLVKRELEKEGVL